jgi:hypothetical protein
VETDDIERYDNPRKGGLAVKTIFNPLPPMNRQLKSSRSVGISAELQLHFESCQAGHPESANNEDIHQPQQR